MDNKLYLTTRIYTKKNLFTSEKKIMNKKNLFI